MFETPASIGWINVVTEAIQSNPVVLSLFLVALVILVVSLAWYLLKALFRNPH